MLSYTKKRERERERERGVLSCLVSANQAYPDTDTLSRSWILCVSQCWLVFKLGSPLAAGASQQIH